MNIVNTMLWMKRNAYEESTIRKLAKLLRHLKRDCNTADPEAVKLFIAEKTCENGHKENLVEAYAIYMRSEGLTWEQPFYERYDKKRRAPKEELVDFLINHARIEMKLKLSISKDLGLRPIELTWLTIGDIDLSTDCEATYNIHQALPKGFKIRCPSCLKITDFPAGWLL